MNKIMDKTKQYKKKEKKKKQNGMYSRRGKVRRGFDYSQFRVAATCR